MNRKEMIDYINDNILSQKECNIDFYTWKYHGKELVSGLIKAISKYRFGKPITIEMAATVKHGTVYINGEKIMTIGSYYPETIDCGSKTRDNGVDYESLILERQENSGLYDI